MADTDFDLITIHGTLTLDDPACGLDLFSLTGGNHTWSLGLANGNQDLVLSHTAKPEPKAALLGGLGVLARLRLISCSRR